MPVFQETSGKELCFCPWENLALAVLEFPGRLGICQAYWTRQVCKLAKPELRSYHSWAAEERGQRHPLRVRDSPAVLGRGCVEIESRAPWD